MLIDEKMQTIEGIRQNGDDTLKNDLQDSHSVQFAEKDVRLSEREQTTSSLTVETWFYFGMSQITSLRARPATIESRGLRGLIRPVLTDCDAVDFMDERFVA